MYILLLLSFTLNKNIGDLAEVVRLSNTTVSPFFLFSESFL